MCIRESDAVPYEITAVVEWLTSSKFILANNNNLHADASGSLTE